MAEIHLQEKRGSMAWVWWLLGLIVVGLIVWWALVSMGDDDTVVATTAAAPVATPVTTSPQQAIGTTGPITSMAMLTDAGAMASGVVGRSVALANVPVSKAVSDKAFWAGTSGNEVFVVRGNQNAPFTAPDGGAQSPASVNIYGTVQSMPADLTRESANWNLKSTDAERLGSTSMYVNADSVTLANR